MAEGCPSRICTMLRPMGACLMLLFLKPMLRTVICEATEWTLHLLDWNMFVTEADVYTVRQQYYWSNRGGARPGPLVHWSCWRGWKGARKTGQFWWFSCQSIYVFLSEKTSYRILSSAYSPHVKPILLNFFYPGHFKPVVSSGAEFQWLESIVLFGTNGMVEAFSKQVKLERARCEGLEGRGWGADNEVANVVNRITEIMNPHFTDGL